MTKNLRTWLMAGATLSVLAAPAMAAGTSGSNQDAATQAQFNSLQQQIQALNAELEQIKQTAATPDPAVADLKRSTSDQYADLNNQLAADQASRPKVSVDNGRFQISSADGRFTAAVRGLFQYDTAYYMQNHAASLLPAAYGPDLGSGGNFRRVYLGLSGKVFGDWTYNLNFDFGGSGGTETPGHIQSVYLEYDGLAPWGFRAGAYPAPASIEDATASGDTQFLERNSPSDLQRNIAGGDGRDSFSILYMAPTVYGALSYTGDKIGDGAKAYAAAGATAVSNFDEQQAVVGRLSWLPITSKDFTWLVGANGTYVFKLPDLLQGVSANGSTTPGASFLHTYTLSDPPELTVDSNGTALANTGALPANHITQWGLETAAAFGSLYGQGGYYNFQVSRSPIAYNQFTASGVSSPTSVQPSNNSFSGWYLQSSWTVTGESKAYNPATGAFTPPKPDHPFALDGSGFGAFELLARYSDLNLNDDAYNPASLVTGWSGTSQTYTFYNTVRGGDQRIATIGANWYPNSVIRVALNYELIQNSRLQSTALPTGITATSTTGLAPALPTLNGGQNLQAVALRVQLSL
jgi:phosphate-selective porin OprO/OprP